MKDKLRILCIDDNQELSAMLDLFKKEEIPSQHLVPVNNLEKALDQITKERPDIVVIDLSLQGSNPLPTITEIHRRFPEIRIILYSAEDNQAFVHQSLKAGVFKHVHKGDGVKILLDTIYSAASAI